MKRNKLLILGSLLCLMCGSCRLPYLNMENKDYEELKELSRSTDFTLTIGEYGESLIMSGHFTFEISIHCSPEKITQFKLHSLSFQNSQNDTLSYSLDYLPFQRTIYQVCHYRKTPLQPLLWQILRQKDGRILYCTQNVTDVGLAPIKCM